MSLGTESIKPPKPQLCVHCFSFKTLSWLPTAFGIEFLSMTQGGLRPCLPFLYSPDHPVSRPAFVATVPLPRKPIPSLFWAGSSGLPSRSQSRPSSYHQWPQHSAPSPPAPRSSSRALDWDSLIIVNVYSLFLLTADPLTPL